MPDFTTELAEKLQAELGATERDARRIAEQADRFREDFDREDTPEELIERMKKRRSNDAKDKWNTVVGFLYGPGYKTQEDGGKDNPYLL